MARALVLGGGGPVGVAWETGLAAGLEHEGVRLADADFIVGTSAGSIVGAQLALGRSPQEMLATQRTLEGVDRPQLRSVQGIDAAGLIDQFRKLYTSEQPLQQLRAEMGAFAVAANTPSEEEWLESFGSVSGLEGWPERGYACTAIDTADGSFVTWTHESGVDLGRAVASSCAVPGIFPPVTIQGHRYMDGGVGSTTNATLATGHDKVLVVPVVGGGSSATAAANPALAARFRERFMRELQDLRDAGGEVEIIVPDEESRAIIGVNYMDGSRRREIAEAGERQGRAGADRIREFWER